MKLNNKDYTVQDLNTAQLCAEEIKDLCDLIKKDTYPETTLTLAQYNNMSAYEQIAEALLKNQTITEVVLINPGQLSIKAGMAFIQKLQSASGFSLEALQGSKRIPASKDVFVMPDRFSPEDFELFIDQILANDFQLSKLLVPHTVPLTKPQKKQLKQLKKLKKFELFISLPPEEITNEKLEYEAKAPRSFYIENGMGGYIPTEETIPKITGGNHSTASHGYVRKADGSFKVIDLPVLPSEWDIEIAQDGSVQKTADSLSVKKIDIPNVTVLHNEIMKNAYAAASEKTEATPEDEIPADLLASSIGGAVGEDEIPAELFASSIGAAQPVVISYSTPTFDATEEATIDPLLAATVFGSATVENDENDDAEKFEVAASTVVSTAAVLPEPNEDDVIEELKTAAAAPVCDADGTCETATGPSISIISADEFMKKYGTNPVTSSEDDGKDNDQELSDEDDEEFDRAKLIPQVAKPKVDSRILADELANLADDIESFIDKHKVTKPAARKKEDEVAPLLEVEAEVEDDGDLFQPKKPNQSSQALTDNEDDTAPLLDVDTDDEDQEQDPLQTNPDINNIKKVTSNSVFSKLKPVHGVYAVAVVCLGALAVYTASVYVVIAVVAAVAAPIVIIGAMTLKDMCKAQEESVTQLQ